MIGNKRICTGCKNEFPATLEFFNIPCSAFDLSEKEQQFKCFNYTNLQPLWAEDNLKKNNKIPNIGGGIYSD